MLCPVGFKLATFLLSGDHLLHCTRWTSEDILVKHLHHIALYKHTGLLEQHACESRDSPMSWWLIPAYFSNKSSLSSFKWR